MALFTSPLTTAPSTAVNRQTAGFVNHVYRIAERLTPIKSNGKIAVMASATIDPPKTAEGQAQAPAPISETRQLLAETLNQKEGSAEERQAFSKYLKALHARHAK